MIATIFDIDGTLVESTDFDGKFYIRAVREVLGNVHIHNDWNAYASVTHTGILLQIMEENDILDRTEHIETIRKRFSQMTRSYLENGGKCPPKSGAIGFMEGIEKSQEIKVGFATGGWGNTARLKLRYAGFDAKEKVLCSCDDDDERTAIMSKCLSNLGDSIDRVVYLGDAEWDLQATNRLGWNFIGIGPRLKGRSNLWAEDFSDHDLICDLIRA